jgi:hypothetical protein
MILLLLLRMTLNHGELLSPGTIDPLAQGILNPSIDLAKLDFSQMLDSFL